MLDSVIDTFENQAKLNADKIAIDSETDGLLTYSQLNQLSNKIAQRLLDNNVKLGDVVAIFLPRGHRLVAGLLAIQKIGATYLPIDTSYPKSRVEYLLENSKAPVILADQDFNKDNVRSIAVNDLEYDFLPSDTVNISCNHQNKSLIYLLYTSGSTGNPKGVMVRNDSFTNLMSWYINLMHLDSSSVVTVVASVGFDLSQKSIFAPLMVGGKLTLPAEGLIDYDNLSKHIERVKSNVIGWTPSALAPLIENEQNYKKIETLKFLILGGEPLDLSRFDAWRKETSFSCSIINTYGPTECTDVATFYEVPNVLSDELKDVPIGSALPNVKTFIVNEHGEKVSQGKTGELLIGGIGVSNGYFGDKIKSNTKFVYHSSLYNETSLYHTGDIVYQSEDGYIMYVGRNDNQVKIRGYRIETGEVEANLRKVMPGVGDVVVTGISDKVGNKSLVAYYTYDETSHESLRSKLSDIMPAYMIPSYFVHLEKFLMNAHGKIDHKMLPDPTNQEMKEDSVANDEDYDKLRSYWSDSLRTKITNDTDFFHAGGDSLKALILISKLKQDGNVNVTVNDLFLNPTFKDFKKVLSKQAESNAATTISNTDVSLIPKSLVGNSFAATPRLEYSYHLTKKFGNLIDRNMPVIMQTNKHFSPDKVEDAAKKVYSKFDALRATFDDSNQSLKLSIGSDDYCDFSFIDLKDKKFEKSQYSYINELCRFEFVPTKKGMFKVWHLRYSNVDVVILLTHHLISDGQSLTILKDYFCECLSDSLNEKQNNELASFKDYSKYINERFYNEDSESSEEEFWKNKLLNLDNYTGKPLLDFTPDKLNWVATKKSLQLNSLLLSSIKKFCEDSGITVSMFLAGTANLLLYLWVDQDDFLTQMQVNGRNHTNLQKSFGYFVNSIYWPVNIDSSLCLADYFKNVKSEFISILTNQDFPDERISKLVNKEVKSSFFYNFISENNSDPSSNVFTNVNVEDPYSGEYSEFDLIFEAKMTKEDITIDFIYRPEISKETSINKLIHIYQTIVNSILSVEGKTAIEDVILF